MRIGLLTEGGYPYATGESRVWCDRLVRGLAQHEFDIYALSRSARQEAQGRLQLPPQVRRVRTAPLWAPQDDGSTYGRRERRRFAGHFGELTGAICAPDEEGAGDRFAAGLYGLAELAGECGGLQAALRSETAVRVLESACRAPGAGGAVHAAKVPDYLESVDLLERALRPLSLDWYDGADGLGAVDLCHAASGGSAALPGLLAKRFFGVPLLVTEYGVQLRAQYLAAGDTARSSPVRALLAAFHGKLAAEVYDRATLITPGNTHARRWQERCGADRAKLRTVYPGMEAERFAALGEGDDGGDPGTLVWVGRVEPAKDLISLLHAFAEVRKDEPQARLRIVHDPQHGQAAEAAAYLAHCKALAAQLFPDEAADAHAVGDNPVSFEEIGGPEVPDLTDAYAAGSVVVLSSVVEGCPISLVEAMFCGRATVSTDVGAVVEVIGGTGLVVPPRNPRALADACVALMRDPQRRDRLGAAARARALELFTVEQNLAAFRGIYLELISHCPVRREAVGLNGEPLLFANPAETHVPGSWAGGGLAGGASGPSWAGAAAADPSQTVGADAGAGAGPGLGERHA
ncbi:GT4 family glycosyltransferase PelF [Streptomyces sp. ISL-100]|uniref:GT4 family glycosyltransferase PelF n=1 Tax=Streptomyces sp. ISL-100 TaxID=2819173 RepID=UPI001BEA088B|nr:GT4 family glycosyltransferase PelF [Streptomyces sp. ISL-100]MBT2400298.1 GT4 family glycosyltransferase PelF [Streptomyces sp. ISL-100]